jgi:serine phosphatase RsbU (regulator of sigma subunit)/anti-sigma regulatory factor (Ser/Thr protein kinase)
MSHTEYKIHRFELPSVLGGVDALRAAFTDFLKEHGVGEASTGMWLVILSELAVNAIEHGNKNDASKTYEVCWYACEQTITIEVADQGTGPPEQKLDQPGLPEDALSDGGRGLFLIDHFVDSWEHWRSPSGYRTRVRKHHEEMDPLGGFDPVLEQAMDEMSTCYESLAAFYRLGNSLTRSESVGEFISQALSDLAKVAQHDYLTLNFCGDFQHELKQELQLLPLVCTAQPTPLQAKVAGSGQEIVWETLAEVSENGPLATYACGICSPVKAGGSFVGLLTVARRSNDPYFNAAELNTIRTFSELVGIAVVNASNTLARSREARALRELEIAAEMQDNLLPIVPRLNGSGWETFARRKGAREVAGDHVEVIHADTGDLYLVCIDVMGKGVSAAFLAAIFRTALHLSVNTEHSLVALASRLNDSLIKQIGDITMFATCAIARIDADRRQLALVNAGHCPIALLKEGTELIEIEPSGPPLGLFPGIELTEEVLPLSSDSHLLMVTDGLYEWEKDGDIWGWEPLMDYFKANHRQAPETFWDGLQALIRAEADDPTEASDDQTLLYWRTTHN